MDLQDFVSKLDGVREMPSGVAARCPAHDDSVASLMVNDGEHGGIVVKCHAGCTAEAIVKAMGLGLSDLMGLPYLVEVYQYTTEDSEPLYTVERWANPKTFRGYLPPPAQRVLYAMPWVRYAREHGSLLYLPEGERDVNTLLRMGIPATTNPTGAGPGKWFPHYADMLAGCHVAVLADNDAVGRAHAREIGASLQGKAASVVLLRPRFGKDITDLVAAGYGLEALEPLPDEEMIGAYRADQIKPRKVEWAWNRYFPIGKISMIEGDPGDGKSVLTIDLAARWSTGSIMPDGTNGVGPWPVILVSAEDDPEDTLIPRLRAAGARLDYIHLVTHGITPDLPFDLSSGLAHIGGLVQKTGARGVIVDPLMAFLGGDTDTHSDHSVRRALQPLKRFAELAQVAMILVRHLNKGGVGTKAIYRGGGSIGFVGASRATFVVAREDGPDGSFRVLACVKSNLVRRPPALRYSIESNADDIPYLEWHGEVSKSAQELLDGPKTESDSDAEEEKADRRTAINDAAEFLEYVLANGPMAWDEIKSAGRENGYSEIALRRARSRLGLVKVFVAGEGNRSVTWKLRDGPQPWTPPLAPLAPLAHGFDPVEKTDPEMSKSPTGDYAESPAVLTDDDRDESLAAAPLVCDVCQSPEATRWAKPWWVVRCRNHNPMTTGR